MVHINYYVAILTMSMSMSTAFACKPGGSIDVFFEKNSAAISKPQFENLARWVEKMQNRYPKQESLAIGGLAELGEEDAQQLGQNRELAVRLALIELGFTPPEVYRSSKIYVIPPGGMVSGGIAFSSKRVEIDFIPACPHECGTCPK